MRTKIFYGFALLSALMLMPAASAISVNVSNGEVSDIGVNELTTEFGMVKGEIRFSLGEFSWVPSEIWLVPENVDPEIFNKGLTQDSVIQMPENVTSSTCRTAVYYNKTSGYGFKVYNTGTTTQIFKDGKFCGLAYNGTYFMFARN